MSEKIVVIGSEQTEVDPRASGIEIVAVRADEMDIRIDGRLHVVPYVVQGSTVHFAFEGGIWVADVTDKGARAKARHRDHSTSAPMPGLVLKILVKPGDVVTKGAALVILEAMKMEHQIIAPHDGTIESVNCKEGELVQPGVELVTLQ
ncbi:MAG: acetyl-CoA carboxylase biotin carboxyl carrier protein subunit [Thermoanaerobaculia bacterium]